MSPQARIAAPRRKCRGKQRKNLFRSAEGPRAAQRSAKIKNPPLHNLQRTLHNLRFFIHFFFFIASAGKIHYTKSRATPVREHRRSPDHKSPSKESRPMTAPKGTHSRKPRSR